MKKITYLLLTAAVMGLIFLFSSQPYHQQDLRPAIRTFVNVEDLQPLLGSVKFHYHNSEVSAASHGIDGLLDFLIRKTAHFFIYFLLMCLLIGTLTNVFPEKFLLVWCAALLFTCTYAALDEYHQTFTPDRTPYIGDVLLDTFGALTAGMAVILSRLKKTKQ
ncbi:VanZ family protein [Halobacillus salinarum]|uniref:VanZ family protein n=1 Tax=Halobacillus salinarum TaxID=2932257 RepID=A0ABY4EP07_9BACI|nr:VanZ family protein [Halobacillus salinarum]UOQ45672.1 VanZ family protein [Halobacillus salinarum]